jgi:hypothetical protein
MLNADDPTESDQSLSNWVLDVFHPNKAVGGDVVIEEVKVVVVSVLWIRSVPRPVDKRLKSTLISLGCPLLSLSP